MRRDAENRLGETDGLNDVGAEVAPRLGVLIVFNCVHWTSMPNERGGNQVLPHPTMSSTGWPRWHDR